jgi:hypothetical protein
MFCLNLRVCPIKPKKIAPQVKNDVTIPLVCIIKL